MMYLLGKTIKYTIWFLIAPCFLYHLYIVSKKDKPEEAFGVFDPMLHYARLAHMFYNDLYDLLTKPPVQSLLMERPPMPPGYMSMKTLVLNVSGTLAYSEYKVSSCYSFRIITNGG